MFFFFPGGYGGGFFSFLILFFLIRLIFRSVSGNRSKYYEDSSSYDSTYDTSSTQRLGNQAFFVGAFSMLAKLCTADGPVSEGAVKKINQFMVYDLKLDGNSYQYAKNIFKQAQTQNVTFESMADSFYGKFASSPQILQLMIDIFYRVAMEDGKLTVNEERLIDYACRRFNISQSVIDSIKRKYGVSGSSKNYAVLGLKDNATDDEIKKAYRKLILEFHPDTIAGKGLGEEFKEFATKRFREIQQAYEEICRERGIK